MKAADEVIEVNREEFQAMRERKREALGEEDYQKLQNLLRAFNYLADLIGERDTTISQLRALLQKPGTEKTGKVLERAGLKPSWKTLHTVRAGRRNRGTRETKRKTIEAPRLGCITGNLVGPCYKFAEGAPHVEAQKAMLRIRSPQVAKEDRPTGTSLGDGLRDSHGWQRPNP
jgi:hypothetical protein